jgi:HTH-type transcriptional regulator, global nitrogen regulator NrpRI
MTKLGMEELAHARVRDKIGFVLSKIEILAFKTTLNPHSLQGNLPVNVSLYSKVRLKKVLESMRPAFEAGLCVSDQIALAGEGERLGDVLVPQGRIGIATVCSTAISGYLLKNGIPMDSKFGGILEMKQGIPLRFVELIYYSGSSLDPSEVFIQGKMTSVRKVSEGRGNILANFREIPSPSLGLVKKLLADIRKAGIRGVLSIGDSGEAVCQTPVGSNRVGMVLADGLNPVAYAQEMGIEAENYAMSTVMDYQSLTTFSEICAGMKRRKFL